MPTERERRVAERLSKGRLVWAGALAAILLALLVAFSPGRYRRHELVIASAGQAGEASAQQEKALSRLRPRGTYAVIDSFDNRFRVYRNGELVRDAVCSTGSGAVLRDPRTNQDWVFDTPLGEHRIERKAKDPVWVKPDWAFVEEGFEPPADSRERNDRDSLGDYGLYLGDGYLIHGTLFKTLLGRRITHGCIRLGDEDLEFAFRHLPLGARVYIY